MRIFAIGDIHGHYVELVKLLSKITDEAKFDLAKDHLVLLGDLVDAGPNTKDVIDICIEMKKRWPDTFHPIRGNHDDMMVDSLLHDSKRYDDYYLWYNQGGKQTVMSYMPEGLSAYEKSITNPLDIIPKAHLDFIDSLPFYWETDKYFFVHAGLPAPLSEINLNYPDIENEMIWIRDKFIDSTIDYGKKIIFGHTSKAEIVSPGVSKFVPIVMDNKIGINTMPRNDGMLTCLELPAEKFYFQEKI